MRQDVDRGSRQVFGTKFHARLANRENLGVRGRVVSLSDTVRALGQDLTIPDDDRRERATAFCHVPARNLDRALCEIHVTPAQVSRLTRPARPSAFSYVSMLSREIFACTARSRRKRSTGL